MEQEFDVAIIGGGIIGAAAAFRLMHRNLRVVLLEKGSDVCSGVSKANSGIVHGGFHYSASSTLKGKLELAGNLQFDRLSSDLGFPFRRCGILVSAFRPEEMTEVERLYHQGVENRVPGIELCSRERILELEPKLRESVCGGLYAPGGGVVEPYSMVFALIEAAKANGLVLKTSFHAVSAEDKAGRWKITSRTGESVTAEYAVNAAGLYADEVSRMFGGEEFRILPRKGEEYLLDRASVARPSKVIFPVPSPHTKGVLVIPTAGGTTMIGPTAHLMEDKEDTSTTEADRKSIFASADRMVRGITEKDLIASFSGSRPVMEGHEDFFIERSGKAPRLIQAAGILSPGLTASPAIAERIETLLFGSVQDENTGFHLPEKVPSLRDLPEKEADRLHAADPAWTDIVCRCEQVSEAEIRLAVRRGHRTLDGVKLATRAGMGRCQGGFCTLRIMRIIAEECHIPLTEVMKREAGSNPAVGRVGETEGNV